MTRLMPGDHDDAKLRWDEGNVPVSTRFDDPYYARADGLTETRHVFLDGNALHRRFATAPRFAIAELGFGTGLNFLATWALWRALAPGDAILDYTSFELYPLPPGDMARALKPWPELRPLAGMLLDAWQPGTRIDLPGARLRVIPGDARHTVPAWSGQADAWFLDGFAPARNPELWEAELLQSVHDKTRPGGTFATYSAAGFVRRSLLAAGFVVNRRTGFGTKREMLAGSRPCEGQDGTRQGIGESL